MWHISSVQKGRTHEHTKYIHLETIFVVVVFQETPAVDQGSIKLTINYLSESATEILLLRCDTYYCNLKIKFMSCPATAFLESIFLHFYKKLKFAFLELNEYSIY